VLLQGRMLSRQHDAVMIIVPSSPCRCLLPQTQHQLHQIEVDARLRVRMVYLDAVPPVSSIALVHAAEVHNLKAPVTIRDGAADDGGVWHFSRILPFCYNVGKWTDVQA
jgi:hypothetical protein